MGSEAPNLFQGSTGPVVKSLQQRLAALGLYKGPINGSYTPDTAMAVVAIQRQEKLQPVNGGMYEDCWDALARIERAAQKKAPEPPPPAEPPPAEPPRGRVTSPAVVIVPPSAALFHDLRFEARGRATDLVASAPGHEGAELTFAIEAWRGGAWTAVGTAKARVQQGVARTPMPAALPIAVGEKVRFRIDAPTG